MVGIYKITSPSGKIYIGQSVNIERRFYKYKIKDCKPQTKLYRSLNKYGVENHIFEIIEECEKSELNIKERYYQDLHDVINKGLNCVLQELNGKSGKLSEETKLKISKNHSKHFKGKKHSEYSKQQNRLKHLGKKHSFETCLKMSKSKKGKNSNVAKKVICTKTLKIWDTITDCALELNLKSSTLARYLKGVRKNKTTIIYLKEYEK